MNRVEQPENTHKDGTLRMIRPTLTYIHSLDEGVQTDYHSK